MLNGERIELLRGQRGLTQREVTIRAGITESHYHKIIRGKLDPRWSTVEALAGALECSTSSFGGEDALWGPEFTSPTPVSDREHEEDRDPDVSPIQSAPGWRDEDYEGVRRYESEDVRLAAGTGTFADQEPVPGEVKFRTSWLRKRRLRAKDLFLVEVSGDSMEPKIYDGDSALVDESRTSPRSGRIYALRTGDGLLVKRLRKRNHRWWAVSDNDEYEPQPLDDVSQSLGRVVWWAHTDRG